VVGTSEGKIYLENLIVHGIIVLKLSFGNWMGVCVDFIRLANNRDKWLALFNTEINSRINKCG
jgi:hypothetical protein